jgi:FtsH-binding integral membrane protein
MRGAANVSPRRRNVSQLDAKHRRWTVITSGLLLGALAVIVTFTTHAAFVSPAAVVVVAAVGVMALMLQLRLRYPQKGGGIHLSSWLNLAGGILALSAFLRDWLHIGVAVAELLTLAAIGCFGVSGVLVLHNLRKRRAEGQSGN